MVEIRQSSDTTPTYLRRLSDSKKICTFADVKEWPQRPHRGRRVIGQHNFLCEMKLNGFVGTGSGKFGSSVFSVSAGSQIVRQYQPVVANPSTAAQVNQRARLKLMSQVAAALAPVIAMAKAGLVSARNQFISKNMDSCIATGGVAQVTYENLQLTSGNLGFPSITAARAEGTNIISVNLSSAPSGDISRVVYIMYRKTQGQLEYVASNIVKTRGESNNFPTTFPASKGDVVLFAYGMKDANAAATAKYENYNVASASDIATLVASRTIAFGDYTFTQTRGTTIASGSQGTVVVPDGQALVFVTAAGPGTVTGGGAYDIGTSVTVTATPKSGAQFLGWRRNNSSTIISTELQYTFTLQELTDLVAVFNTPDDDNPKEN